MKDGPRVHYYHLRKPDTIRKMIRQKLSCGFYPLLPPCIDATRCQAVWTTKASVTKLRKQYLITKDYDAQVALITHAMIDLVFTATTIEIHFPNVATYYLAPNPAYEKTTMNGAYFQEMMNKKVFPVVVFKIKQLATKVIIQMDSAGGHTTNSSLKKLNKVGKAYKIDGMLVDELYRV